ELVSVRAVAFSPDGKLLAARGQDQVVRLWEAATGKHLRDFKGTAWEPEELPFADPIVFSPDGSRLACRDGEASLRIWRTSTGEIDLTLKGQGEPASARAYSRDGTQLHSAGEGSIWTWDALPSDQRRHIAGVLHRESATSEFSPALFSPDGSRIVNVPGMGI